MLAKELLKLSRIRAAPLGADALRDAVSYAGNTDFWRGLGRRRRFRAAPDKRTKNDEKDEEL
jgi:hypothetical protein